MTHRSRNSTTFSVATPARPTPSTFSTFNADEAEEIGFVTIQTSKGRRAWPPPGASGACGGGDERAHLRGDYDAADDGGGWSSKPWTAARRATVASAPSGTSLAVALKRQESMIGHVPRSAANNSAQQGPSSRTFRTRVKTTVNKRSRAHALLNRESLKGMSSLHTSQFIFNPTHPYLRAWWNFLTFMTCITLVQAPYRLGFGPQTITEILMQYLAVDICFLIDMFVEFNSLKDVGAGFIDGRIEIAVQYLKLQFWLDLLSAMPWDLVFIACFPDQREMLALLGLLRLIRTRRLFKLLRICEENIHLSHSLVVISKLLFMTLSLAHLEACGQWYVARVNGLGENTWVGKVDLVFEENYNNYFLSLYWAMTTISTVGYGDLVAQNQAERIYHLLLMLVNMGMTAYILGNITLLTTHIDVQLLTYREKVSSVEDFLDRKGISGKLREAALKDLSMNREMGQDKDTALEHVSPYIRNTILRTLYYHELSNTQVFFGTSKLFLDEIIQEASVQVFHQHSLIVQEREHASHVFLVLEGFLYVYSDDNIVRVLGSGEMIGLDTALCNLTEPNTIGTGERMVSMLGVTTASFKTICERHNLNHRIALKNLLHMIKTDYQTLDEADEPAREQNMDRILKVEAHLVSLKTDIVTKACHAASVGNLAELERLSESDPEHDIDAGDYDGRRPVHIAAAFGQIKALEYLVVKKKADVNIVDKGGGTPLRDAVLNLHVEAATFLRQKGANLNLPEEATTLNNLVQDGQAPILKLLLQNGANASAADYDGRTPLHIACADGMVPIVKLLMRHGADINARDRWGVTPAREAMEAPELTVKTFLDRVTEMSEDGLVRIVNQELLMDALTSVSSGAGITTSGRRYSPSMTEIPAAAVLSNLPNGDLPCQVVSLSNSNSQ